MTMAQLELVSAQDGILLLDKPLGLSSNGALQQAKRILGIKKAGHTGSLDPLASGLLPLCFGEATKFSRFLLDADKQYRAVFRLGEVSTTGDAEGEIMARRPVDITVERIREVMVGFLGDMEQVPPMYSALKHQGRPLYEIARAGASVPRLPRPVHLYRFDLIEQRGSEIEVEVVCSKGTYIRSLAVDLGEALGCGAHVNSLRRLASGSFQVKDALTLEALQARTGGIHRLLPMDAVLTHLPALALNESDAEKIRMGQAVRPENSLAVGCVRFYLNGFFLGIGENLADGMVVPRRLLNTNKRL